MPHKNLVLSASFPNVTSLFLFTTDKYKLKNLFKKRKQQLAVENTSE